MHDSVGWISVQLEEFVGTFEVSVQAKASISILSRKKYRLATLCKVTHTVFMDYQITSKSYSCPTG